MNKQQVVSIHGGGEYIGKSRDTLVDALREKKVDLDRFRRKESWRSRLQDRLGEEYDVLAPKMPNPDDPRYPEWEAWFSQIVPHLDEEIVLVGHSLGALFLIKYLSENEIPKKVKGLFLVAAPYVTDDSDWRETEFGLNEDFSKLSQAKNIFMYHSDDDVVVPFTDLEKYESKMSGVVFRKLSGRNHMFEDNLPEIIDDIKSCS